MTDIATKPAATLNRPLYRVRLLAGYHTDNDAQGRETLYKPGDVFLCRKPYWRKWPEKFARVEEYVPLTDDAALLRVLPEGEQVDSDDDFDPVSGATAMAVGQQTGNSAPEQKPKTPLIEDEQVLNAMTLNELKSYAEDEEIDLKGASRKEDILRIVRSARAAPTK